MAKPDDLKEYYRETAYRYDQMHLKTDDEHFTALKNSLPVVKLLSPNSILDVGCGTGRALAWYAAQMNHVKLTGVDPSPDMLEKASQRLPDAHFIEGSGEQLSFKDNEFDLVVATGIMHHVDQPDQCIREMFRIAKKAVLISDHNNFAFGSTLSRKIRLSLFAFSLLKTVTFFKQGFNHRGYSEEDGWWYPYSLFNNFKLISELSDQVFIMPTRSTNSLELSNLLLCQSHIAILATKCPLENR